MRKNNNVAPFPLELEKLVETLQYRPGWTFTLADMDRDENQRDVHGILTPIALHCIGLTLDIITLGYHSYHEERGETYSVHHYMPVPAATYNRASWRRWLLDQCLLVERHEACEFFAVAGTKPYAPSHGPGSDPYLVREVGTDEDVRTSYLGAVKPAEPSTTTVETP